MRAVVDSASGSYFRCLLENGDLVTIHKSFLPEDVHEGSVLQVAFTLNEQATKKQKELMQEPSE